MNEPSGNAASVSERREQVDVSHSVPLEAPQISRLVDIMDQQLLILRRIDQRQAAADLARQPIPEVPATSSSAWNALLGSTLTDTIEPRVERWRSGLDALLVFLGLFSAIVTAFLVNSISGLTQDTAAITNEILLNLTAVVVSLGGGTSVSELNSSYNGPFQPDASNVRINSFWSISLTFSLSIAALAVGCRGFLNMATWSRHKKASERLADVWTRWTATDRLLRPVIESLPWLLILPVFLFIIGILDLLFSSVRELLTPPPFLLFAFGLSVLCITVVATLLCFTLIDGSIHPASSPFQSRFAHRIHTSLIPTLKALISFMRRVLFPSPTPSATKLETPFTEQADTSGLPTDTIDLYHKIVQLTHEDESLDQAAGALFNIIQERAGSPWHGRVRILSQECATLRHLLSPEASIRSNRTAAWTIVRIQTADPRRSITYPNDDFGLVLASLTAAAKRAAGGSSLASLWDSPFVRAISVMLLEDDTDSNDHPIILHSLTSKHSSWKDTLWGPPVLTRHRQAVLSFLLDVLYAKLHEELPALPHKSEARLVDILLSPKFTLAAVPISLDSRLFMQSLAYHSPRDNLRELTHLVRWIIKVTSPDHVIAYYLNNVDDISATQVKSLSWAHCGSIFSIVDAVGRVCLELEVFDSWKDLADLCTICLVKFITFRDRLAIAAFPFDLILTFSHVVRNLRPSPASVTFQHLTTIYQYAHDTPHSRYTEVLSEIQELLDIVEDSKDLQEASRASLWDVQSSRLSWKVNDEPTSDWESKSDLSSQSDWQEQSAVPG